MKKEEREEDALSAICLRKKGILLVCSLKFA